MRILIFLLAASLAQGEVTIRTVRSSGGDYAGTLAGLQSAVDFCRSLDSTDPCILDVEAGLTLSNGTTCHLVLNAQSNATKMIVIRSSRISELAENVRVTEADVSKLAKIENACSSSPGVVIVPPETTGTLGTAVASHYLLQGLELHYSGEGRNAGGAMNIGLHTDGSTKARAYWQSPHTIILDRVWTHGNDTETWITASSTHANQNGVRVDGRNITVKNSLVNHNNMDGVDHGQAESHGLAGSNMPGPLRVLNSKFDGAITSLIGGEWTWIPGLVATGAEFFGNEYTRNPLSWHWLEWATPYCCDEATFTTGATTVTINDNYNSTQKLAGCFLMPSETPVPITSRTYNLNSTVLNFSSTAGSGKCTVQHSLNLSEPCVTGSFWEQRGGTGAAENKWKCVAGAWASSSDTRTNRTWNKNGFEFKSMRLASVRGNWIHTIPSVGDQSQYGFCWLINQVDGQEGAYFARVEFTDFLFNHCEETAQGPTGGGLPFATAPFRQNNNIRIRHNLITRMGGVRVSPAQGTALTTGGGTGLQTSWIGFNLIFDKNTTTYDRSVGGAFMKIADSSPVVFNVSLRDSIGFWGSLAQSPLDNTSEQCSNFRAVLTGAAYWDYFGLVDSNSRGGTAFSTLFGGSGCPANVSRAADIAAVKFVDADNGDYRLCTDTDVPAAGCTASPWATAASDGGPLGADALQVSRMTAGAKAGTYDPGLFEMKIVEANANQIRYSPYHARGACTVTVTRLSNNTVTTNMDDAGFGNLTVRYLTPTIPAAGEYRARITCKDAGGTEKGWGEREFKVYQ